jgi:ApaG protein
LAHPSPIIPTLIDCGARAGRAAFFTSDDSNIAPEENDSRLRVRKGPAGIPRRPPAFLLAMSDATTMGIRVLVTPSYLPESSAPERNAYLFSYRIRITNHGDIAVRLLRRHWTITDGNGHVEEVEGPGVIGETPVLRPGASFEYTSFCPLPTPFGTMRGSYLMRSEGGGQFDVEIAPFSLIAPQAVN